MLDVKNIKNDFPTFKSKEKNFIYLDSASTSQKPQSVIDSVSSYYDSYSANIHRALYEIGEKATDKYESVREKVRQFMNVPDSHSIILLYYLSKYRPSIQFKFLKPSTSK